MNYTESILSVNDNAIGIDPTSAHPYNRSSMKKRNHISRVENLLRRVVEEPFNWMGGSVLDPFQLATHLSRFYEGLADATAMPTHFTVFVNPDDYAAMETDRPALERQVADYVVLLTGRRGYHVKEPPVVTFEARKQEKSRSAHVVAEHRETPPEPGTAVYSLRAGDATLEAIRAADAFLIVQGRQHIPLDQPIIRIGRRMDNDIVLDSPAISRQHAQIRWRQRYFVLYDVSNRGHTVVNGAPCQEHILRPGDVIALQDIFLVYGEGREDLLGMSSFSEQDEMDTTLLKPEE